MDKIEKLIKEYNSKKLKEIIDHQSYAYSKQFIEYSKDELIKRGESFVFNSKIENEIGAMNDSELKNLVEKEWNTYHLEYLEIARMEYLKRGFKNEIEFEEEAQENSDDGEKEDDNKYPALRTIASIYPVFASIIAVLAVLVTYNAFTKDSSGDLMNVIPTIVIGALIFLVLLATGESIKVFIDIEENTRKGNE